jgi:hypothetical protein
METELTTEPSTTEEELVFAWRFEELQRAGFTFDLALDLAVEKAVDLHRAIELIRRGCPHVIAARILL